MNSRYHLWGWGSAAPAARMVVRGADPNESIEMSREVLCGRRRGVAFRDAKVQIGDALVRRGSTWRAWSGQRGREWVLRPLDLLGNALVNRIPALSERTGYHRVLVAAQGLDQLVCDLVFSVPWCSDGASDVVANRCLEVLGTGLESRGLVIEQLRRVRQTHLEVGCPAHPVTRVTLEREAKKLHRRE